MMLSPEIDEALRLYVGLLESHRYDYAVGGAVAMNLLKYIRATRGVDVLAIIPAVRHQEFADAASSSGFAARDAGGQPMPIDVPTMARESRDLGQFRLWWKMVKIETFLPKVPLQDAVLSRKRRVGLGDFAMWITTAEDLILLKMIFHRDKDLVDVRRLIAANRDSLDVPYVKFWIPRTLEPGAGAELEDMLKRVGLA